MKIYATLLHQNRSNVALMTRLNFHPRISSHLINRFEMIEAYFESLSVICVWINACAFPKRKNEWEREMIRRSFHDASSREWFEWMSAAFSLVICSIWGYRWEKLRKTRVVLLAAHLHVNLMIIVCELNEPLGQ